MMENLLSNSNDMPGLNIICNKDDDVRGPAVISQKMRKPKKKNKYEKRRAKARQAKQLKEKKGATGTNTTRNGNENNKGKGNVSDSNSSSNDNRNPLSFSSSSSKEKSSEDRSKKQDINSNNESHCDSEHHFNENTPAKDIATKNLPVNIHINASSPSSSSRSAKDSTSSANANTNTNTNTNPTTNETKSATQTTITSGRSIMDDGSNDDNEVDFITSSSRRNQQLRTEQLLKDEVKRAEYMSTYHARPFEMDRKSGATWKIQESKESDHIFGNDDTHMDMATITNNNGCGVGVGNGDGENIGHTGGKGADCPFACCGLHPNIVRAITSSRGNGLNLKRPTVIQRNAWKQILVTKCDYAYKSKRRKNLFVQSETGSGKTLAYLLPVVQV